MSGHSIAFTYNGQVRNLPPLPPPAPPQIKSANTTLSQHLYQSSYGYYTTIDTREPKKFEQNQLHSSGLTRSASNIAQEYRTTIKWCSLILILITLGSISISKLSTSVVSSQNHNQIQAQAQNLSNNEVARTQLAIVTDWLEQNNSMPISNQASPVVAAPDVLKSKLVIGEFVILSQNYTNSPAQKSLLFENIVKLIDQVFLSTEVRRVYSRMEITGIRPFRPSGGIVVDCSIVLSESIAYAAQQFGIALYESLTKSNGKLANQPSFIIDKNSIRLSSSVDFMANSDGQLQEQPVSEENAVVWSEWSQWSSCVDKNGVCDATRLHSRLRKCVSQLTGDKVDSNQCRQRFNMQDFDLEVEDCARSCPMQPTDDVASGTESYIMADAPSDESNLAQVVDSLRADSKQGDAYLQQSSVSSTPMAIVSQSPPAAVVGSTTEHGLAQPSSLQSTISSNSDSPVLISAPQLDNQQQQQQQQQQMSCSNCTSDEICLLLVHQKVPFCAKVRDRLDESGCGGWCKAQGQLCQPVGQNAFKCIHDSECLRDEWRCHDSACIPLSKRCDGHSNCYDSSDERDCPNPIPPSNR